jgi:prolipoprotein diacylglyceryltransferase
MLPILNVGPLAISLPGLIVLLGLWLGLSLAERHAARFGVKTSQLYNLAIVTLVAGMIGARLAYVIRYPQAFGDSPLSILSPNYSLLDPWGGLALGLIAALIYAQRASLPFWPALDALTPMLAVMAIAVSLAQLSAGTAFGAPTTLPWGVELWGARRHPTQIYQALVAGLILAYLWPGRAGWMGRTPGRYFLTFLALSAGARLFLEAFRGDSELLPGGLRQAQALAWLVLAASLWGLHKLGQHSHEPSSQPASGQAVEKS